MALILANRVQESGTANTTVSFTLTGAVLGFQNFSVIGDGNTTYYAASDAAGNWEVGLGTYSSTGPTLTRTTVYESSNSGLAVTFSGVVNVFVTYPSSKSVNLDATGNVSPLGTVSSGTWQGSTVGVAYGGTGVTASSGANSVVLRDANQNIVANSITQAISVVTSAGGTTVLTSASPHFQILIGTSAQTFRMPDATLLPTGSSWVFDNDSTQNLTVTDGAGSSIDVVPPGGYSTVFLEADGTVAGTWARFGMLPSEVNWGTNSLDLGGSTVITNGIWQGNTIQPAYGGTGLTTFVGANNALYSTGASTLTAGTLPAAAGGTGLTSFTANGVVYASGTGTLATGSALVFDGTNLGIGRTPRSVAGYGILSIDGSNGGATDWYANGTRIFTAYAGTTAANISTAGAIPLVFQINDTEGMRLTSTGLGIGTSSPGEKLEVNGTALAKSTSGWSVFKTSSTASDRSSVYVSSPTGTVTSSNPEWLIGHRFSAQGPLSIWKFDGSSHQANYLTLSADGNLGLGVTPSAWNSAYKALDIGDYGAVYNNSGGGGGVALSGNAYEYGLSQWKYKQNYFATLYRTYAGQHQWMTAPSGTAGNAISFTQAMTLDASGNLGIGTSSPSTKLHVTGSIRSGVDGSDSLTAGANVQLVNAAGSRGSILQLNAANGLAFWSNGAGSWAQTMTLDASGNLGLGVTPSGSWGSPALMLGRPGAGNPTYPYITSTNSQDLVSGSNAYWDGTNWRYQFASSITAMQQRIGFNQVAWYTAPSGTAGNAISFTQAMTLDASGLRAVSYKETQVAMGANDVDLSAGNYFSKTISGTTTLTVSNIPASTIVASFILDLTNGGSATVTWWAGVKWQNGTAPTLTAAGRDVLGFFTYDGGTTWTGLLLAKDVK